MADEGPKLHPHIFAPAAASSKDFTSPKSGRGNLTLPQRTRGQHADHLLAQLHNTEPLAVARAEEQKAEGVDEGNGIYLVFKSTPGFDLKFESLDVANSGIELCTVRKTGDGQTEATVYVPDGKLTYFLNKITAYRDEDGKPSKKTGLTKPKNQDLVSSIGDIQLAALQSLWTDLPELYPAPQQEVMWEVWLRRTTGVDHVTRLRQHAERYGLTVSQQEIVFIDRTIVLVHGTAENLARSNDILGAIAEVRLAKTTADFFTRMNTIDQQAWVNDLIQRSAVPIAGAPYICLLDTGINRGHPLLAPITHDDDIHTYNPNWGKNDQFGHGTPMAGLAAYGDLTEVLGGAHAVQLTHRIESVKLFNDQDPHAKALYGAVTQECVSRVEVTADRTRVYCMAVTTSDDRDRGRPSSWSAAVDALTSGFTDGERRLMIVAAGNTVSNERRNYPNSNHTDSVHDPAQAWNALTVGGCTDKAIIDQARFNGWQPLAPAGDLSPCSCTSMTWSDTKWPIKPDIVLEAGNMGLHQNFPDPDYIDDALQLLSTPHDFALNKPLVTFGDTSAATALASRMAAMVWAKYPQLTPEAVRALIVHSASWTPAMQQRCTKPDGSLDLNALVRCYGYGTPGLRQLLSSADDSLTLIAQGEIQPFHKDAKGGIKYREMRLHELPWPRQTLEELQDTEVTLRVTLSYFVEPNPGSRGWSTKYGYQSHGLRFDVKRATENVAQFQERINKAARTEDYADDPHNETGSWIFRSNQGLSALGSIRSNIWTGPAADLAARGYIAVYPTYGWWNKRPNLGGYEKSSHYALIATITTPETDIYTPVAAAINLPILIEV
jgi:hypothetical protein